ncbi:MAG: hypothetical protein H8E44_43420 [Planctomycetes bacterium]|nr:hypothetical protein [Planctomycetota bacterium]MBL7038620.1 hypothetical protein [Pirellulaceae bacterium]
MVEHVRSGFRVRTVALFLAVLVGNPLVLAQADSAAEQSDKQSAPVTDGQRVFTCGHSFHVFVYRLVGDMAKAAGFEDHQSVGLSGIGGSRVIQHWDVPEEKNKAKAALRAGNVDVLTLSPIWLPDAGIEKLAKLGLEHNPEIRVMVQEFWLPNDTYEPIYPLDVRKKVNHNATDLADLRENQARYLHDLDDYVRGINQELGKDIVFVVPVGQAALALREKIAAGKAPGLKMQWDLFRDPWGHAQPPLTVLSGYCHFAMIYRRSPIGLPVPKDLVRYRRITSDVGLRKPGWRPSPEEVAKAESLTENERENLNRLLQELAWEAVTKHPTSGIKAPRTKR